MRRPVVIKIVSILAISLLIPWVFGFAQHPFLSKDYLFHDSLKALIFTVVYWEGNMAIFKFLMKRYPNVEDNAKRLVIEFILVTIFSVTFSIWGCGVILGFLYGTVPGKEETIFFLKIGVGLTYFVLAIYEGENFFRRWRQSLLETEELKRQKLVSQFEVLKQQVSPHFLFNTLNTLMTLIPEDQEKATRYTEHLSKVYRYVLMNKDLDTVSLRSELEFVDSFFFLNKIRFGNKLFLEITIGEDEKEKVRVAPLSLQILIENAIKHNEISEDRPLDIQIYLNDKGDVAVKNTLQRKKNSSGTKVGLENIISRYKLLVNEPVQVTDDDNEFVVILPKLV